MTDSDCPLCGLDPIESRMLGQMFQLMLDLRSCPEDMSDVVERLAEHLMNADHD